MMRRKRLSSFFVFAVLTTGLTLAAGETLVYELRPDFDRHTLEVRLSWQTGRRTRSVLSVSPSWGQIRDVTRLLKNVHFSGASARRDGAAWVLSHAAGARVRVSYTVDSGRTTFDDWDATHYPVVTGRLFHGMGNAFLMTPRTGGDTPATFEVILRWQLPADADAVCSWGAGRHIGDRLKATDIRHSVYMAGRFDRRVVTRGEHTLTVAMVDAFAFDADAFVRMTKRIIDAECAFMLDRRFPDFVITANPVGKRLAAGASRLAGTGLYHSLVLFLAPGAQLDDAVQHLFAHELFHTWNGRALAAAAPERRVFWFVEGLTDYFSLRILYTSGIWSAQTYCKWINQHLREYARNPAIHATNAEIERGYWTQRDTVGEVPYQRGLALGLRWESLARQHGVRGGLDAWMIGLVDRGREGFRVSNSALREIGTHELGRWFAGEFDRYVVGAATVPVPPDALGPGFIGQEQDVYTFALGFDRRRSLERKRVIGLDPASAAAKAGLRAGDELLGWNIQPDPDVVTRLIVRRGSKRKTISYHPRGRKLRVMQFRPKQ